MGERKRGLAGSTAIAALLALTGLGATAASATPPAANKAVAKKAAKKPAGKPARKAAPRTVTKTVIVYVPAPPAPPLPAPPPPPQDDRNLGPGFDAAVPAGAYGDVSRYRYIDDADALLDTVGTSPPDYAFRFDGADGWAWALSGGDMVLAEPVGDRYRFYAFGPGDLYPFFVGDETYSYGFAGRALAAVYDADAQLVSWTTDDASTGISIADNARWLSEHGRALKASASRRSPVVAADWASSQFYFGDIELRFGDWRSQPGWSRYRTGAGSRHRRDWRARLGDEGTVRRDRADRFDEWWRSDRWNTPPPNKGGWIWTGPGGPSKSRDPMLVDRPLPGAGRGARPGSSTARPSAPNGNLGVVPPPRTDGRPGEAGRWPGREATPPGLAQPGTTAPAPDWKDRPRFDNGASGAPPATGNPLPPPVYVAPRPRPPYNPTGKRVGRDPNIEDALPAELIDTGRAPPAAPPMPAAAAPPESVVTPPPPLALPIEVAPAPSAEVAPTPPTPVEIAPPPTPAPGSIETVPDEKHGG